MSELWFIWYTNQWPKDATLKCGFKVCEDCLINWVQAEANYEFIEAGNLNRTVDQAIDRQKKNNYSVIIETLKWVNAECQQGNDGQGENAPKDIRHRLTFEEVLEFVQKSEKPEWKEKLDKVLFDILTPTWQSLIKWPRQGCEVVGFVNLRQRWSELLEWEKWLYTWSDPNLEPHWK